MGQDRWEEARMAEQEWQSLPAMFFAQAARLRAKPFLWSKRSGQWESRSYGEVQINVL